MVIVRHLTNQRLDRLDRQNQSELVIGEQPVVPALAALNALVLAEGLAPAFEVGRVTYQFAFEHAAPEQQSSSMVSVFLSGSGSH